MCLARVAGRQRARSHNRYPMKLAWREASDADIALLSGWNHRLIRDEGHRNTMGVEELAARMRKWLQGEYRAVVFSDEQPLGYALFRNEGSSIYLRQFFVRPERRRRGVGRAAFELLRKEIWSSGVRLTVDVPCRNAGGVAFWRSLGYQDYCLTLEIMPAAPLNGRAKK